MKRRRFISAAGLLGSAGALLPAALLPAALQAQDSSGGPVRADVLIRNARVYTMDGSRPAAQAVALMGTRILAVGSNEELSSLQHPGTEVIDASGATVTP
ncbi:MAG: amidohydrolase, partial [Xanthomonadales bacterium]|nr:amidohydrolase [Xanthomonadales bacterium]